MLWAGNALGALPEPISLVGNPTNISLSRANVVAGPGPVVLIMIASGNFEKTGSLKRSVIQVRSLGGSLSSVYQAMCLFQMAVFATDPLQPKAQCQVLTLQLHL